MKGPTQQYSDTIKSLQSRIQALEDENRLLKERLEEAGVSYANIVSGDAEGVVELYDPDQGARIKKFDVTDKIASDFFMMFCRGRKDVYDLRYTNPKTGKNGYYSQCFNRWDRGCHIQKKDGVRCKDCELRAYKPVTLPLIKAHMNGTDPNGNDVVAIYPMLENNLCQLLVFDFDNHAKGAEQEDYANIDDGWKEEINALRRICKNLDVDAVVERSRSGRGAHLWIFFKEMVPARLARRFGFALLEKGAESVNLKSFKYYDRMIPTQDALPEGGLGNVIALPLQGMALKSGNSAFIDENWNAYEDQLNVLAGTRRLTRQGIEDYLSLWYSTGSISEDNGTDAPWDKNSEIEAGSVKGVVRIVLADRIYIDSTGMSNKTKRQLRRMATFSNKQYFQNQAMDMPNYDESRFIYLGSDEGKYIVLPRGLREEILKKFDNAGISYKIEDKRTKGQELNISFRGELRESQIPAVETMLENETGILHAATAFGKTVVCCDMIARRGISTLILVDRADLMNQWIKRLEEFLDIDEELPEYQTKTGRTRKRKSLIGNLQGAHDTLTGIVDVAMIRSLKKKDGFHPKLKEYAQVYFDECHHAASDSAIEVLQEIRNSRSVNFVRMTLGFTAELADIRTQIWKNLAILRKNEEYDNTINSILSEVHFNGLDEEDTKNYLQTDFNTIYECVIDRNTPNFFDAKVVARYKKEAERLGIKIDERYMIAARNPEFRIYRMLTREHLIGRTIEEDERLRKEAISKEISVYDLKDFKELFSVCKFLEKAVCDREQWNLNAGLNCVFEIIEGDTELYLEVLKSYFDAKAPFSLNGYRQIKYLLDHIGYEATYCFINNEVFAKKDEWMAFIWECMPEETIDEKIINDYKTFVFNNLAKDKPIVPAVQVVARYCERDSKLKAVVIKAVLTNPQMSANFLSYVYDDVAVEGIINFFENDIIALASIYMSAIENNCHIDYDGKLFKRIFEQHPTVWNEYVDWIKSKDTMCGDGNEHKIIELIWGDDKWRECVEYAFKVLIDDDVIFHIKEPADMLFTNTTDETILERKKYWLIEKLRETSLELKKCKKLIEMVVNVLPDWKLEYILEFLKINKNPEDFKEIPLFPSSYSWSGSEIPLIMEKIDFLKSLKDNIKGINFIEHRKYIEEYRMNLERYKDNVELREYLENADYA